MPNVEMLAIFYRLSLSVSIGRVFHYFLTIFAYLCLLLPTLSQQSIGMVFHYFSLPLPTFAYFFSECYSASVRVFNNFQA